VDLNLSQEQRALQSSVRKFFAKESPPHVVGAAEPLGFDTELWRKVVALGLPSIAVPEHHGGGGGGHLELVIAAECAGYHLAPVPFVEASTTVNLLASLLDATPSDEVATLLARTVAGEVIATTALRPASGDVARVVPAGAVADLVVVLRDDELIAYERPDGRGREACEGLANLGSTPIADCQLDGRAGLVLARGDAARQAHDRAVRDWKLLLAAALVGLGTHALEMGVDYVMQRHAFGVLIATFQTIQHRLADNATALDGARLLAYEAAWARDVDLPSAGSLARMSFLFASEMAFKTAAESLHFHGGYGYTLEYDIQLYFRRAKAWPLLAGDPRAEYAALAHRLFDPAGL